MVIQVFPFPPRIARGTIEDIEARARDAALSAHRLAMRHDRSAASIKGWLARQARLRAMREASQDAAVELLMLGAAGEHNANADKEARP